MRQEKTDKSWIRSFAVFVILLAVLGFVYLQRYAIHDWWRLRGYTPSAEIVALADDTTMNDGARRVFYVYHPSIEPRENFNEHCGDDELTIVLGCYSSVGGIHIFDVNDDRLHGIMQVTAAHELLHAVYERLSDGERAKIDALTRKVYENITDQRIRETVQAYHERDPSVVPNELHSILGTEVEDLPNELEAHYARYFDDRAQIVGFSKSYESAFSSRKEEAKVYETQLRSLKEKIDSEKRYLEGEYSRLSNESSAISALTASPDADESINTRIAAYNARVREYNSQARAVSGWVDEYNALYDKYKQVVLEQQDLFKSIDSRPQAID